MTALKAEQVTRRFGGVVALDHVDLDVEEGEVFGIIGPNGAGKTTLMNVISGLDVPTFGRVWFRGRLLNGVPPHKIARMGIARTFQITRPFAGMTVRENVAVAAYFGRAEGRLTIREALVRADEMIEWCGIQHRRDEAVATLTTGERKRLELARALAMQPELLLLDEVMAGLTPREMSDVVELIRRINRMGVTVIMVEHVVRVVMQLCQRVLVLHHGKPIKVGAPREVASDRAVISAYLGERYAERMDVG